MQRVGVLGESGRLLIVANHPSGALDALALLDAVGRIRRDLGDPSGRTHLARAGRFAASIERPNPGRVYNVADDAPSSAESVLDHAAALLGREPPEPRSPLGQPGEIGRAQGGGVAGLVPGFWVAGSAGPGRVVCTEDERAVRRGG